jgi:hypothetical protein
MRFEVLMTVKMLMLVYWVLTLCGPVGRYQRFGGTYCLHLHSIIAQKTNIYIICVVQVFNSSKEFHMQNA